ncbi:MAG: glycosyltransferase, partial [Miltoncostaeaceae bacterium]
MARVLYVSQYFVSGDQPGGVRHWQHCRALARAGHDVTVVTSYVQHKERTIPDEYRGRRIVRSSEDGLDIVRTYSTPGYGRDLRSRLSNYGTFALWSAIAELRLPRPDVVVASSPSLRSDRSAAASSRRASEFRRASASAARSAAADTSSDRFMSLL